MSDYARRLGQRDSLSAQAAVADEYRKILEERLGMRSHSSCLSNYRSPSDKSNDGCEESENPFQAFYDKHGGFLAGLMDAMAECGSKDREALMREVKILELYKEQALREASTASLKSTHSHNIFRNIADLAEGLLWDDEVGAIIGLTGNFNFDEAIKSLAEDARALEIRFKPKLIIAKR